MAKYVIPPKKMSREIIIKCLKCGCLYVPEYRHKYYGKDCGDYEDCPTCGYSHNSGNQRIPLWKYNLIKWLRGGFNGDKGDQRSDSEQCERAGSSEGTGSER